MSITNKILKFIKILFKQLASSSIFDGSATLSFYFMLAVFPALMVGFSFLSWFSLSDIEAQMLEILSTQVPKEIKDVLIMVLADINSQSSNIGFISIAILFAFWTVSSGIAATLRQVQSVHRWQPSRGFIFMRFISILLTLSLSLTIIASLALLVLGSSMKKILHFNDVFISTYVYSFVSSVIVAWFFLAFLMGLYFFGSRLKLKSIWPGALVSTLGFLSVSQLFSFYVTNFTSYSAIYGSIAAVIILMLWFYILGFLIILGAEINEALRKAKLTA